MDMNINKIVVCIFAVLDLHNNRVWYPVGFTTILLFAWKWDELLDRILDC